MNDKIILKLDEDHEITIYRGIEEFQLSAPDFKHLWESHPSEFHEVMMHGKLVSNRPTNHILLPPNQRPTFALNHAPCSKTPTVP